MLERKLLHNLLVVEGVGGQLYLVAQYCQKETDTEELKAARTEAGGESGDEVDTTAAADGSVAVVAGHEGVEVEAYLRMAEFGILVAGSCLGKDICSAEASAAHCQLYTKHRLQVSS